MTHMKRVFSLVLVLALILCLAPLLPVTAQAAPGTMTIYLINNWLWDTPTYYYWGSSGTNPGWPGYDMTYVTDVTVSNANIGTAASYKLYKAEIPTDLTGLIFNKGSNEDQSKDITSGWFNGATYYMFYDGSKNALTTTDWACVSHASYADGKCTLCGTACAHPNHTQADTVCATCGSTDVHTISGTTCTVCGYIGGKCGDNAYWTYDGNGTLSITGTGDMYDYTYRSNTWSPWCGYSEEITSVTVGEGITRIGNLAFFLHTSLQSVTLPSTVTAIGDDAFKFDNITSITLPAGLTSIGSDAFRSTDLTSIEIPDSVTNIGARAFSECCDLASVKLPTGITAINDDTFEECSSLTSITIPASVTSLGDGALAECYNLTTITFLGKNISMEDNALDYNPSLTTINVPCNWEGPQEYEFSTDHYMDYRTVRVTVSNHVLGENDQCAVCGCVLKITTDAIADQTYTGEAITPAVGTITWTGDTETATLTEDTDYTVSYSNNIALGTATATISPVEGSDHPFAATEVTFRITADALFAQIRQQLDALDPETLTTDDFPAMYNIDDLIELLEDAEGKTEAETTQTAALRAELDALKDIIYEALSAVDTENVFKALDLTEDNATAADKPVLEASIADLEAALQNYGVHYTDEQKTIIQDEIAREESLLAALSDYTITAGANGVFTKGTTTGLSFTANGPIGEFTGVEVDGKVLDKSYYSVQSDSTVISLNASYLETLGTGEHTITVLFKYSEASCKFTVKAAPKPADSESPATGDDSALMLWSTLAVLSIAAAAVVVTKKRFFIGR